MGIPILDHAKDLAGLVKKIGDIDLYEKIVDLQGEIVEMSQERLELTEKVQALEERLKKKAELVFCSPFYKDKGGDKICPCCWERDGKAIHIIGSDTGRFDCPACSSAYYRSEDGIWQTLRVS